MRPLMNAPAEPFGMPKSLLVTPMTLEVRYSGSNPKTMALILYQKVTYFLQAHPIPVLKSMSWDVETHSVLPLIARRAICIGGMWGQMQEKPTPIEDRRVWGNSIKPERLAFGVGPIREVIIRCITIMTLRLKLLAKNLTRCVSLTIRPIIRGYKSCPLHKSP